MTKAELVAKVAEKAKLTKDQAEAALGAFQEGHVLPCAANLRACGVEPPKEVAGRPLGQARQARPQD